MSTEVPNWRDDEVVERDCVNCVHHRLALHHSDKRYQIEYAKCAAEGIERFCSTAVTNYGRFTSCGPDRKLFVVKPREVPDEYDFEWNPPPAMAWI